MRLRWFRRRWRWLLTLVLLLLVGLVWFVIIHMPSKLAGHLLIERQQSSSDLFYNYDFASQQLQALSFNNRDGLIIAHEMNLAQDSKRLVFVGSQRGGGHIYVADYPFTEVHSISIGTNDFQPQLSPDGSKVIFARDINYFSAIFIVDLSTKLEKQLTQYTNDLEADWSPDGKRIVFTTSRDGFQELYTMAPDGSDLKRLTNNVNQNDLEAKFSPDGKWIAYMTNYSVGDGTGEIWLMDSDGQNQRRLTNNQQDDRVPTWSPDSRHIAFTRAQPQSKGTDIFIYDLDTDQTRQVTNSDGYEFQPVWSPDSTWLAFSSNPDGSGNQFYIEVVRTDGTERHALLHGTDNISTGQGFTWMQ